MNRKQEISKDLSLILDGLALGVCLWVCYFLRSAGLVQLDGVGEIPPFSQSYWMLAVIIPVTPLLLDLQGFYDAPLTQRSESLFLKMANAGFWLILIISVISFFGRLEIPSRSVLLMFLVLAPLVLIFRILGTRRYLVRSYQSEKFEELSVLVGSAEDITDFLKGLNTAEKMALQISRWFDLDRMDAATIKKSIRSHSADRVIFVSPDSPKNEDLPFELEAEGLEIWVITRNINGLLGTPSVQSAGRNRVLVFRTTTGDFLFRFTKRAIDIVGSLLGIIIFSPVCLVIAAIIKMTSPGPVIFRQVRNGRRGKRFTILKFRSMVADASALHAKLIDQNEMQGPAFKVSRDPRVTRFGEFLRKTSLDELPQFINVLRGDMTLVGPRPLPDYETAKIEQSTHRRRLSVKPGLTCLWQIRGRNSITSFEEWVQLDIEYIDTATLLLDLWIIIQTIPAVLFGKGAR